VPGYGEREILAPWMRHALDAEWEPFGRGAGTDHRARPAGEVEQLGVRGGGTRERPVERGGAEVVVPNYEIAGEIVKALGKIG